MQDLHKFLFAISAACFIGVGSGFIALMPYVVDYEAKAMKAGYELEQATGLDYSKGIDCSTHPEIHTDCNYATYLLKTNTAVIGFLKKIAYFSMGIGIVAGLLGSVFHFGRWAIAAPNVRPRQSTRRAPFIE